MRALTDVSIEFRRGEVHALLGANGAGKSTLLNILSGSLAPTRGEVLIDGEGVSIARPKEAESLGIVCINQELALVPGFSATDNITLGLPRVSSQGFLHAKRQRRVAEEVAARLGLDFDLQREVRHLGPAERGMVSIARALARDARFIAMDEPTAALSDVECERLFRVVRELSADGVSIAYVSHRLGEVEQLCDRVSVFKEGRLVDEMTAPLSRAALVRGISGEGPADLPQLPAPLRASRAETRLRAQGISDGRRVIDVSFDVRAGEIVGLAGVVGAGRSEALELVLGSRKLSSGTMEVGGRTHAPRNARAGIAAGIGLVPEERRSQALVMDDSVRSNIALGNWDAHTIGRTGLVSDRKAQTDAVSQIDRLRIKTRGAGAAVRTLSGGNQQKVVLGRWMSRDTNVLLLDEPTRGVDIGARRQIWDAVEDFVRDGRCAVVVSSELDELRVCHRVFVIVEGRTVEEMAGPGLTEEQMLAEIYSHRLNAEEGEE
ncbi:sugar ABC transporter ATP-binding protein [Microbacterium sp. C23T]